MEGSRRRDAEHATEPLERVDSAGDIPRPVMSSAGVAMKTVLRYAINWRLLYATHPCSAGHCNDKY